jgi:cell division septation protein DedD
MRSLLDTEEVADNASEITLSTTSLLGIFFGLVLICGVFFGFGYSMGRGVGPGAQASTLEAGETAAPENSRPPAADPQGPAEPQVASAPAAKEEVPEEEAPVKPGPPPIVAKPAAARPSVAYVPPADAPPTAAGQPMVQIAAVARREDADVLVSALRQRGYGVVVRNEPQDKLLHVQVGPFADRTQATAIKQKLLSDGYNAIIKQ